MTSPSNGLQRQPVANTPRPTPAPSPAPRPISTARPTPAAPAPQPPTLNPSGGLVRPAAPRPAAPAAPAPSPVVVAPRPAATVTPAVQTGTTFDSGLSRTGGLVRPDNWDHRGVPVRSTPYCPPRVVNHSAYGDYPWRTTTYVSYSSGPCAPRSYYPLWPYTSSPFYGSSLRGVSVTYWDWCAPRYVCRPAYVCAPTYWTPCPPTYVVYPAPVYGHRPAWDSHVGVSYWSWGSWGSSFSFSVGWGSTYSNCYDPCWSTTWCGAYVPVRRHASRCYGWWRRPAWGWTVYIGAPAVVEVAEPAPVRWAVTPVNAVAEFDSAVYSTMRGEYQTAVRTMRNAVLGAPESFAPGTVALDEQQLQRAAWAMTVYRNPPQRAVQPADAAFMVAALAAISGDGAAAAQAANEARLLGDRHPATDRLAQMIEWAQTRAD